MAISLVNTEAGRTARALLADEVVDVYRWGTPADRAAAMSPIGAVVHLRSS